MLVCVPSCEATTLACVLSLLRLPCVLPRLALCHHLLRTCVLHSSVSVRSRCCELRVARVLGLLLLWHALPLAMLLWCYAHPLATWCLLMYHALSLAGLKLALMLLLLCHGWCHVLALAM